jgi:hypothetical protein
LKLPAFQYQTLSARGVIFDRDFGGECFSYDELERRLRMRGCEVGYERWEEDIESESRVEKRGLAVRVRPASLVPRPGYSSKHTARDVDHFDVIDLQCSSGNVFDHFFEGEEINLEMVNLYMIFNKFLA